MRRIISDEVWLQIKTDYQLGAGTRELERKYDVPHSTICSRKKVESWSQESATKLKELQSATESFVQTFDHGQMHIVAPKIKTLMDTQLEAMGYIQDIALNSLKMHKNINVAINNHLAAYSKAETPHERKAVGEIPIIYAQATSLFKNQGMDVHGAMKSIGIGVTEDIKLPQKPADIVLDKSISPADAYELMIKGE